MTLAFLLGVLIVLSPWAIRNQLQFGRPIVTTTHGGYTLLLANNPEFYDGSARAPGEACGGPTGSTPLGTDASPATNCRPIAWPTGKHGRPSANRQARFSTPAWSAWAVSVRRCHIRSWPTKRPCAGYRDTWWPCGTWLGSRWRRSAFHAGERREGRGERARTDSPSRSLFLFALLLLASLLAAHAVYWTDMRMRGPVMPVVALAAAMGASKLLRATRRGDV